MLDNELTEQNSTNGRFLHSKTAISLAKDSINPKRNSIPDIKYQSHHKKISQPISNNALSLPAGRLMRFPISPLTLPSAIIDLLTSTTFLRLFNCLTNPASFLIRS